MEGFSKVGWSTATNDLENFVGESAFDVDVYTFDYAGFYICNPVLAVKILERSDEALTVIMDIIKDKHRNRGKPPRVNRVEIINLPESTPIRHINHSRIGWLVQIEGVITQSSKPEQVITSATYECLNCNEGEKRVVQQVSPFTQYPPACKACGSNDYILIPEQSTFIERQIIAIQESSDQVPSGKLPRDFPCELDEGLVGLAMPGTRATIVGKVIGRRRRKRDPNPVVDLLLKVNNVRDQEQRPTDDNITPEDIEKFREMAGQRGHLQRVTESIAPTIHGCDPIKQAIALQLCEGNTKIVHGRRRRGQAHIALVGDPGEGKSELLESAVTLHPRSIKTTGRGSSSVGLTAAVQQENGKWILKAGATVLADRGYLVVDEITRMNADDREMLHPAMAQGNISINKAGINAVLNTRCSILAACNPTGGRWDKYKTIMENVKKLPPPLVNRFDLIFVMTNQRTLDEEMERAEFVSDLFTHPETTAPPIDHDTLRKFLSYARTIKPKISAAARSHLTSYYRKMVRAGQEADTLMITLRQLEGAYRLAEASAKLHLRETVTAEDAEIAVNLLHTSLQQAGLDPSTGEIDVEMLITGIPKSLSDKMKRLVTVVGSLSLGNVEGRWVASEMLYDWLVEHWKIKHDEIEKLLELGAREGVLWQPGTMGDRWAVT